MGSIAEANQERTLGQLLAKVENIEKTLSKADESRAAVHRRIDDVVDEMGAVKSDIGGFKSDLKAMSKTVQGTKDVTDEVRRWKLMGLGALGVVGMGGTALGAAIVGAFEWISKIPKH